MNKAGTQAQRSHVQTPCTLLLQLRPSLTIPVVAIVALTLGSFVFRPTPMLLWNFSPSSPTGLYVVEALRDIRVGDMIIAWPPRAVRRLADSRHYLPTTVPLIKHVAAVAGDLVCAKQRSIVVNGAIAALRRHRDPKGRQLPWWTGCRRLHSGEWLLLSPNTPLAFDGRYFGPTRSDEVVGKAKLLWEN